MERTAVSGGLVAVADRYQEPGAEDVDEIARVLAVGGRFVYETCASQLLSHPVRSWGRRLPWHAVPELVPERHALLWASRVKPGPR